MIYARAAVTLRHLALRFISFVYADATLMPLLFQITLRRYAFTLDAALPLFSLTLSHDDIS